MSNSLTQQEYRNLKARLTRAQNKGNPSEILRVARAALATFEDKGYPDDWSRWERAEYDARYALCHGNHIVLP